MKNTFKLGVKLLFGALIGFFGAMFLLDGNIQWNFLQYAYGTALAILVLTFFLIAFAIFGYFRIKKMARKKVSGEEEDEIGALMYRRYSDTMLSSTLSSIIGLAGISIAILTEQPEWLVITATVLLVVSLLVSLSIPGLMKTMYPERQVPSVHDNKYAEKLLAISDDGEKHIMLNGLYRSFISTNGLLMGAIALLLIFSIATGTSQLFGIIVISAILAFSNSQYILNIRNK